jgi:hypothetical protein
MKQTAVEWLVEQIIKEKGLVDLDIQAAKEMEKEQMIDFAFKYGDLTTREIADSFDKEYKTK